MGKVQSEGCYTTLYKKVKLQITLIKLILYN